MLYIPSVRHHILTCFLLTRASFWRRAVPVSRSVPQETETRAGSIPCQLNCLPSSETIADKHLPVLFDSLQYSLCLCTLLDQAIKLVSGSGQSCMSCDGANYRHDHISKPALRSAHAYLYIPYAIPIRGPQWTCFERGSVSNTYYVPTVCRVTWSGHQHARRLPPSRNWRLQLGPARLV